jgi:maltose alpha-D-glucosyltransferase/alpha-amylase
MTQPAEVRAAMTVAGVSPWELAGGDAPQLAKDLLGAALEWAGLLGRRTAELHAALASDSSNAAFAPEPYTQLYLRSLYQSSRKSALQVLHDLRRKLKSLSAETKAIAQAVLDGEKQILEVFRAVVGKALTGRRIRCHGDYTLGHVLYTGKDFLIIDFEGKPTRSIAARRIKRSPLFDIAAMFHSFHRAVSQSVDRLPTLGVATPETTAAWQQAAAFWQAWIGSSLVRSYTSVEGAAELLPKSREELDLLLRYHLLAEALDELEAELAECSERVRAPLSRVLQLIGL